MNQTSLVSVIIPCYNASEYISETLQSILIQENANFEIIVVNDGSTDDSAPKILSINDTRILYFYQSNQGVSSARNLGLTKSKGDYIIFFDADDLMTQNFISSRLILLKNTDVDFVSGPVKKFGTHVEHTLKFKGTTSNIVSEILLYNPNVVTCPSNYMFNSLFLTKHKLNFNPNLSSTADKFFLLQCSTFGKSECNESCSELLYRVNHNSMSNQFTTNLVKDNEAYYDYIKSKGMIPTKLKNRSLFLGYYSLAGANLKIKKKGRAIKFALKAFAINPILFIKNILFI